MGIYVHIPICKSRCLYCAFYSTTQLNRADELVTLICHEIESSKSSKSRNSRQSRNSCPLVHTIYFGGGTPSLLTPAQLSRILQTIRANFAISPNAEITLEANPGDFNTDNLQPSNTLNPKLSTLNQIGFNRLSIGIQSFQDTALRAIGRRHTAQQARETVQAAQAAGFRNISIDLIYGLPHVTREQWEEDIQTALSLDVQHISGYGLSVEQGTPLWKLREEGRFQELSDDEMNLRQQILTDRLATAGFEHYEVSNYALPGFRSRHNSSYWQGIPYLGFGPGAHSYDGHRTRSWNGEWDPLNHTSEIIHSSEVLTDDELYEERIMLSLRTREGIDLKKLELDFGTERLAYCLRQSEPYLKTGKMQQNGQFLTVTASGLQILNIITADLFA